MDGLGQLPADIIKAVLSRLSGNGEKKKAACVSKVWFSIMLEIWPRVHLLSGAEAPSYSPATIMQGPPIILDYDSTDDEDSEEAAMIARTPLEETHGILLRLLKDTSLKSLTLPAGQITRSDNTDGNNLKGDLQLPPSLAFSPSDMRFLATTFPNMQSLSVPGSLSRESLSILGSMGGGRLLRSLSIGSIQGGRLCRPIGQQEDKELVGMLQGFEGLEELRIVQAWANDNDNLQGSVLAKVVMKLKQLKRLELTVFVQMYYVDVGSIFTTDDPWPKSLELSLSLHYWDAGDSFGDMMSDLVHAKRNLTELYVTGPASRFCHSCLPDLFRECPNLRRLHLHAYGDPVPEAFNRYPGDVGLHFRWAPDELEDVACSGLRVEEEGIKSIASGCKNLKSLVLQCRRTISGTALASVLQNCTNLQKLTFMGPSISFQGVQSTPEHSEIREMELRCQHLPLDSLRSLALVCPNLQQLKVPWALNTHLQENHLDLIRASLRRGQLIMA